MTGSLTSSIFLLFVLATGDSFTGTAESPLFLLDGPATEAQRRRTALGGRRKAINSRIDRLAIPALRKAVEDLTLSFPEAYSRGPAFLDRLSLFEIKLHVIADVPEGETESMERLLDRAEALVERIEAFRREALLANPLLCSRPILFVVRAQYLPDHHNTATLFQTGEINTGSFRGGGALKTIDFGRGGAVKTLVDAPDGIVRDPDVHFDGERILFSMRHGIGDDYHLYEIGADGGSFRRLTHAAGVADVDPLYLPDEAIAFSSTREPKYCMCNRHIMANLFRMKADGSNITQIGKSTLFEGHGVLLPDGRILYDRWEYVDRNFGDAQGLWTVNPDGTNHAVYFGNNTCSPGGVIDARPIPGGERALCILGSCHDRPWGALAVIDRRYGVDCVPFGAGGSDPIVRTWPAEAAALAGRGNWDTFKSVNPRYEDPFPLSDKYFLCARTTGKGEKTGLFLVDIFGNEIMVHTEGAGCFDPMPLASRPRPPVIPPRCDVIPPRCDAAPGEGLLYVADVYTGSHMQGVARGEVKSLRVVETPEKRFWTHTQWDGQGVHCPAMNWHDFCNKRILGTVPVEEDGSAFFAVPADRFVFFQLLDEKGMMIQSMRSGTIVRPGEITGCVGCHEDRRAAPPAAAGTVPLAVTRPPSRLDGWYGEPRLFSYVDEVQPVFDRACVRCHDTGLEAGLVLNLCRDRTLTFNTSYNELWRRKTIAAVGAGPAATLPPRAWGSHASRLVKVIREGHEDVALSREEFDRIVTWIDLNAPYYAHYASAYPDNLAGRSPLDNSEIARLTELTGVPFAQLAGHGKNRGAQISFDRPARSACLEKIAEPKPTDGLERTAAPDSPGYREALAIIRRGAARLAAKPRADMAGFVPCATDREREKKYTKRRKIERSCREAAARDTGVRDEPCLAAAIDAARWIASTGIRTGEGTVWPADPSAPDSLPTDLYRGSAGVVLFFLELYRATDDQEWLAEAEAGADFLRATLPASLDSPEQSGLYTGVAGIGFALGETFRATGTNRHRDGALRCLRLLHDAARAGSGEDSREGATDIISGTAGTGLFLLYAARQLEDAPSLRLAADAGRLLIEKAISEKTGEKWRMAPGYPRFMPNFSHGTAGIAYFLARLHEETGDGVFLEHALAGGEYLVAITNEVGQIFHHEPGGEDLHYLGWCHGPPGTTRLYRILGKLTGDGRWDAALEKAAGSLIGSGIPEQRTAGFWDNLGVCCGSAGVADFFLDMHKAAGDTVYLQMAQRLTDDLLDRGTRDGSGLRWVHAEHRVRPEERVAQTGYSQGAAGIGLWLLRFDAFLDGRKPVIAMPDRCRIE
jgi:hypothetical protein